MNYSEKAQKWYPLLNDNELESKLNSIATILQKNVFNDTYSLLSGRTGIALFLYYYWAYKRKKRIIDTANSIIINSLENDILIEKKFCSFSHGASGLLWAITHLVKQGFIEGDCIKLFSEIDVHLFNVMHKDIKCGQYDFLHNAIGIGLYFLNGNNSNKTKYIETLITELENISEKNRDEIKWKSTITNDSISNIYNLSLSHGIASIIIFLVKAKYLGIDNVNALLNGAVTFLLNSRNNTQNAVCESVFPSYVYATENNLLVAKSRLAWCYGDLGIGISLWYASHIMQNSEWKKIAIDTLISTTKRKDPVKEIVIDAGICHGSAGIAHIYNRMYHLTGIQDFKESAIYWLKDTLEKATFPDGLAGYKSWKTEKMGGWTCDYGLLEGVAGIGLVFLAAISDIEPKWDVKIPIFSQCPLRLYC